MFLFRREDLGHVIKFNKISKSPDKVRAVMETPRPTNIDMLRRFLGLVTLYSRFISDFPTKTYHLRCLLQKNQKYIWSTLIAKLHFWTWNKKCAAMSSWHHTIQIYLWLTTDASPYGINAILSHHEIEGFDRHIACASRSLTPTESNYSHLDREALAIIFGVTHSTITTFMEEILFWSRTMLSYLEFFIGISVYHEWLQHVF